MAEVGPPGGFIVLHRRIQEHPYWGDPERLRAWLDLLFMAAWKPHRRLVGTEQVDLERGQLLASEPFLAARWRWSRGKVRRFLQGAEEVNEICVANRTSGGTVYAVVKYDDYQTGRPGDSTSDGQAADIREVRVKKGKVGEPQKRATRLPEDWAPNDTHERIAKEEGVNLNRELARFRDHAIAKGRTQLDWDAAFRNWLRSDFAGRNNGALRSDRSATPYVPGLYD